MGKQPRILLYSHDTYGLGHLRRSLNLAEALAEAIPRSRQLLLTGSMVAGAFALPPRTDMIKLPALSKRSSGQYKSRTLPLTLSQIITWREQLILQAATLFKPDIFLVDKAPAGVQGELLPTLRYLKTWSPQTRILLGMRDIEDSPIKTRQEWTHKGVYPLLDEVYDHIMLYGQRPIFDPVAAYGVSPIAAGKLVECGYITRPQVSRPAAAVRRELGLGDQPLVLLTVGGGGDGVQVVDAMLQLIAQKPDIGFHTLVVTGPLMARARQQKLARQAAGLPVTLMTFTPDLTTYMAAADLVISMAGYNSVCELLALNKRMILIPRHQTRLEQQIRAQAMAARGWATCLTQDELNTTSLDGAIAAALQAEPPKIDLNMAGTRIFTAAVSAMLDGQLAPAQAAHNLAVDPPAAGVARPVGSYQ